MVRAKAKLVEPKIREEEVEDAYEEPKQGKSIIKTMAQIVLFPVAFVYGVIFALVLAIGVPFFMLYFDEESMGNDDDHW